MRKIMFYMLFPISLVSSIYAEDDRTAEDTVHVEIEKFYNNKSAKLEIEMVAESAVGLVAKLSNSAGIASIIHFSDLTCNYNLKKFKKESNKVEASYSISCDKKMNDHEMKADFSDFKNIKQIKFKLKGRTETKSTVSSNQGLVILK